MKPVAQSKLCERITMSCLPVNPSWIVATIIFARLFFLLPSVCADVATMSPNDSTTKLLAQAHCLYVSSGLLPIGTRMGNAGAPAVLRFSGSDLHPTVTFELPHSQQLRQVSATYQTDGTALNVYLLNDLPFNGRGFLGRGPTASLENPTDRRGSVIDFAPTSARYIVLRWTRNKATRESFEVTEVSASGTESEWQIQALTLASSSTIEAPPDPPSVPNISP